MRMNLLKKQGEKAYIFFPDFKNQNKNKNTDKVYYDTYM